MLQAGLGTGGVLRRRAAVPHAARLDARVGLRASGVARRRPGDRGVVVRLLGLGQDGAPTAGTAAALAMVVAGAAIAATAVCVAPRFLAHRFTGWDVFLGYELPQPPTVASVLTMWRFDSFLGTAGVVLALGYVAGYAIAPQRKRLAGRQIDSLAGRLCVAGIHQQPGGAFLRLSCIQHAHGRAHDPEHVHSGAAGDGRSGHSRAASVAVRRQRSPAGASRMADLAAALPGHCLFSNPIVAFVLFVGSPYVVYFTPLFDTLIRYHWGHEFMPLQKTLSPSIFIQIQ